MNILQGNESVTRLRETQTGVDRYNNPVFAWVPTVLYDPALFDPGGSREPVEVGRAQVVTTPKLYFPGARPDITEADRVEVRGHPYTVEGQPADWRFGDVGGLVVELREAAG